MSDFNPLSTKPGLLNHLLETHASTAPYLSSMPYPDLYGFHELDHQEGNVTHSHNEDVSEEGPSFQELAEREAQRIMAETQKRYEAAWQAVVAAVQHAGAAKARFEEARKVGNDVMNAAMDFRKCEAEVKVAVDGMIDLIAKEHA